MPLVDGIGDEVVQFGGAVLVLGVAALAWWSTNTRPNRANRYSILGIRSRRHGPITLSIPTRSSIGSQISTLPRGNVIFNLNNSVLNRDESTQELARVIVLQEMDSIDDADVAIMNNHRLRFYRRHVSQSQQSVGSGNESTSDESEVADGEEGATSAQIREMDSIVSAMEADVDRNHFRPTDTNASEDNAQSTNVDNNRIEANQDESNVNNGDNQTKPEEANNDDEGSSQEVVANDGNAKKILIKLKYLNDTQKEVEGSLDELLKDFKWRHFSSELSRSCRVRLIFNGRVLSDEGTLRACGLHHQAVVHCLIHPSRPAQPRVVDDSGLSGTRELITEEAPQPERSWDLESILMTLVSVALTVVWFFRCEYSNMFTASASVALFGLTVFYSVAIFGLYLSDTFHFDRRPAQPVPNN